jgi:hypothetical protein
LLIPSNYAQYYADTSTNQAREYWCEHEREIILLWPNDSNTVSIAKVFAADFIQDNQILLVNNIPTLFSTKLKVLLARCPICERDNMPATGNMFYNRRSWDVEYWCTYDQEVFTGGESMEETLAITSVAFKEALAHGQISPDL